MSESAKRHNRSDGKKGGMNNQIIVLVGAVIIILLVVIVAILLFRTNSEDVSKTEDRERRDILVSDENASEVIQRFEEKDVEQVAPGQYTATMNFEWHFATGDSESRDSYVANSMENTNDVYFDVFLEDDTEDTIYESPIIPRGSELRNIRLKKDLDAGTYDCLLVYHLVDEEQNSISTASFTLTVVVEG